MPAIQPCFLTPQITEDIKKWPKMVSNGFPLTPVTKIHGWHRSDLQMDPPHLETLEGLEIVSNLMRIPIPSHDPKISDIGSQILSKTSKMTPKNDPKTRKLDFQKHLFYSGNKNTFWGHDTFQTYQRNKSRNLISFLPPQIRKSEPAGSKVPHNELLQESPNSLNFIKKST